jgi:hypothetical protein
MIMELSLVCIVRPIRATLLDMGKYHTPERATRQKTRLNYLLFQQSQLPSNKIPPIPSISQFSAFITFQMDHESVYTLSIGLGSTGRGDEADSRSKVQQQLIDFILDFRVDNQYIYRYDTCTRNYRALLTLL